MTHFTLSFYEGEERPTPAIPKKFNSVKSAFDWVNDNGLPPAIFTLTEWDESIIDAYGIPEILDTMNLEEFAHERV